MLIISKQIQKFRRRRAQGRFDREIAHISLDSRVASTVEEVGKSLAPGIEFRSGYVSGLLGYPGIIATSVIAAEKFGLRAGLPAGEIDAAIIEAKKGLRKES